MPIFVRAKNIWCSASAIKGFSSFCQQYNNLFKDLVRVERKQYVLLCQHNTCRNMQKRSTYRLSLPCSAWKKSKINVWHLWQILLCDCSLHFWPGLVSQKPNLGKFVTLKIELATGGGETEGWIEVQSESVVRTRTSEQIDLWWWSDPIRLNIDLGSSVRCLLF